MNHGNRQRAARRRRIAVAGAALVLTLAGWACGGGGGTSSSSSSPTAPSSPVGTSPVQSDPSFSTVVQEIFERHGCTVASCHGGAQSADLNLLRGSSYASLVGVRATSEPFIRVVPGNADESYLVIKLEGRQSVGARMPQTGSPLGSTDLANIRNWINQGAKNN